METNFFKGEERLAFFAELGRDMRMGSPDELKVSNRDRLIASLQSENKDRARGYLTLVHQGNTLRVFPILLEWSVQFATSFKELRYSEKPDGFAENVYKQFLENVLVLNINEASSLCADTMITQILTKESFMPGRAHVYRADQAKGNPAVLNAVAGYLDSEYKKLDEYIQNKSWGEALASYNNYFNMGRTIHDMLIIYTSTFPDMVSESFGQNAAEKIVDHSFRSSSFFEPMWSAVVTFSPLALAAFLAEHLRDHYSGKDRGGSVQIIEESDCYKLICSPCGSGGALRNCLHNLRLLPAATPATWGLKGCVPLYCTHCAFNSITAISKVGYPALITEFQSDPNKECSWVIYKDPQKIPEKYFHEVGLEKHPG